MEAVISIHTQTPTLLCYTYSYPQRARRNRDVVFSKTRPIACAHVPLRRYLRHRGLDLAGHSQQQWAKGNVQ